jgi:hypothetical protein
MPSPGSPAAWLYRRGGRFVRLRAVDRGRRRTIGRPLVGRQGEEEQALRSAMRSRRTHGQARADQLHAHQVPPVLRTVEEVDRERPPAPGRRGHARRRGLVCDDGSGNGPLPVGTPCPSCLLRWSRSDRSRSKTDLESITRNRCRGAALRSHPHSRRQMRGASSAQGVLRKNARGDASCCRCLRHLGVHQSDFWARQLRTDSTLSRRPSAKK